MIGKMLAHYEITAQLGKGGMGEVYRAKDQKLGRDVAIKVLPEEFARDPERIARFEREAKLLASLNHPNIAAIHGLEESDGIHFLVLELVEGETLADHIAGSAAGTAAFMPAKTAALPGILQIALQIAEALEAAHEKGIIHRDLKPANIKITPNGKVKVLDFGLAKAFAAEQADLNLSNSPTLSDAATQQGIILGTAAYMSPEQARGKPVDKRADIWAFGVVLFEMLTGRQLFGGDTISDTLASVLTKEPEWEKVPAKARRLLQRCLEKDPMKRLRDIGDAYALLETVPEAPPVKKSWLSWGIAGALALAFAISLWALWRSKPPVAEPMRLQIAYPDKVTPGQIGGFALSPDGRHLAFVAMDSDGIRRLWVRDLQSFEIRSLAGTESAKDEPPFWSPDSRYIAFDAGGKLKKVDISGGPPIPVCNLSGDIPSGSWNADDVIIFGTNSPRSGIMQVSASAAGGTALPVTRPVPERQERSHTLPAFLPDGRHFLYCINSDNPENTGVYLGSLDARPEEQPIKRLMASSLAPQYIPAWNATQGMLLFQQGQRLVAQPFDEKRLELIGDDPVPIADQIGAIFNYSYFSASANGILIYRSSSSQVSQPAWFDRQGKILDREALQGRFGGLALSPNGTRTAISWDSSKQETSFFPTVDIWLLDLARGPKSRFAYGREWRVHPIWSPDGTRIAYSSNTSGGMDDLYIKPASGIGNEKLLLTSNEHKAPTNWSRDGRFLLYTAIGPKTGRDIWVLPMENGGKQVPVLQEKINERDGRFSPDMRWIAYVSDETGIDEVYVCGFSMNSRGEFMATAGKHQISQGGGTEPRWRGDDGKELFYRVPEGKVMAVEVNAGTEFTWGKPKELFPAPADLLALAPSIDVSTWDVTADGKQFLLITPLVEGSPTQFNVILNWTELLKK